MTNLPTEKALTPNSQMSDLAVSAPAVLFGSAYTVLGTGRSLGRHGIPVYCASEGLGYITTSRWCREIDGAPGVAEFSKLDVALRALPFNKAVLFPCSDHWVTEIAHLDSKLKAQFPCVISSAETIDVLLNKGKLALALQKYQFPAPLTMLVSSDADLDRWPKDRWPISFLKPCDSQKFMSVFFKKALRVSSQEEAHHWMLKIMAVGIEVVLQEYVPGPASRHFFLDGYVDSHGELKTLFARQRLRMFPLDFGDSCCLRSVTLESLGTLPERFAQLLKQLNYRGIFSAEFKHDPRDGEYRLLEINARPWWFISYAADCGVNVATMAYRDALGEEVPKVTEYRVGAGLVSLTNDKKACWALFKKGKLPIFHWIWSWLTYRKAVFNWDDPAPTLALTLQRAGLHSRRLFGKRRPRP